MLLLLREVGQTCSELYRGLRGVLMSGEGLSLLLALRNFTADVACE